MIKATAVILNSRGLHARPASQLAKLVSKFQSDISVSRGKRSADASSIAELLMLAAPKNTEIGIAADGPDAQQAVAAILELVAEGFNDGVDSPAVAENPPAADVPPARETRKIDGIGTASGAVVGKARLRAEAGESEIPRYQIPPAAVAAEQQRFDAACQAALKDLSDLRKKISHLSFAAEMRPFLDLYSVLLDDPALTGEIRDDIARSRCNAEWAVKRRADAVSAHFCDMEDEYLRGRGEDVRHAMRRLLAAMKPSSGRKRPSAKGRIAVATELDPAHVILLRQQGYAGFAVESGGNASHTAILARSMGMPAIVGAKGLVKAVEDGDDIVLDMDNNAVLIRPARRELKQYAASRVAEPARPRPRRRRVQDTKTQDGEAVLLEANIELPEEARGALDADADGIGLFRTEFLFLNRNDAPSEDEQFEIYRKLLRDMSPLPVVARTLDLGLDKAGGGELSDSNPLGMRAIRYCLAKPKLFLTQLRAMLRAGMECGNLKILIPMLSHPAELEQTAALVNHAREQIRTTRGADAPPPPLGGMLEVPASVFLMRAFARHLDFFSIGTNDLIQYMLAADRGDERLARYYQHPHPAIARVLADIVTNADRVRKPVTLCGEMAGNPEMTSMLLSLGLRRLSMAIPQISPVRRAIAGANASFLAARRRRILSAETPESLHHRALELANERA